MGLDSIQFCHPNKQPEYEMSWNLKYPLKSNICSNKKTYARASKTSLPSWILIFHGNHLGIPAPVSVSKTDNSLTGTRVVQNPMKPAHHNVTPIETMKEKHK